MGGVRTSGLLGNEQPYGASVKAQHYYRSEFDAGRRVPSFEEAKELMKFQPSNKRGVYGVYYVADANGVT